MVTTHMLVKVGSSHEYPGQSGLSHALEHLLYRGSAKTARVSSHRSSNAWAARTTPTPSVTSPCIIRRSPSDRLAVALELNADLLKGAVLSEHEFVREIEAVKAERRENVDNEPLLRLFEQLQAIAYPQSSYHTPVIGWMSDLQRMHNDELRAWYHTWYAPNNATLIIVGDVRRDVVKREVEKYFAGFPAKTCRSLKAPSDRCPRPPSGYGLRRCQYANPGHGLQRADLCQRSVGNRRACLAPAFGPAGQRLKRPPQHPAGAPANSADTP
nr:insulinase family protein [Pseudomonas sp. BIGb0427]